MRFFFIRRYFSSDDSDNLHCWSGAVRCTGTQWHMCHHAQAYLPSLHTDSLDADFPSPSRWLTLKTSHSGWRTHWAFTLTDAEELSFIRRQWGNAVVYSLQSPNSYVSSWKKVYIQKLCNTWKKSCSNLSPVKRRLELRKKWLSRQDWWWWWRSCAWWIL